MSLKKGKRVTYYLNGPGTTYVLNFFDSDPLRKDLLYHCNFAFLRQLDYFTRERYF